jgi:hypothetical protein
LCRIKTTMYGKTTMAEIKIDDASDITDVVERGGH